MPNCPQNTFSFEKQYTATQSMSLQLSATVACWKDDALYVVEVDASSQGIQILYRKRMQQHGTFGEMTKPTNCAKFLMIEQPTICSNVSFPFCPSSSNRATQKESKQQHELEAAVTQ